MTVVGFDFGTTNSLVSVISGDRVVNFLDGDLPFPSVVRYEGESVIVGRQAKDSLASAGLGIHGNVVVSPKFHLGEEAIHVGGVERNPVDVVSDVIAHIRREALANPRQEALGGLVSAIATIPVDMTGPRRARLRDAFRRADIGIAQFVHEPLAALYGYLRNSDDTPAALRELQRRNILVVDWGGGTLDLTLCRIDGNQIVQLRNSGTDRVGGDAFDEVIRTGVLKAFYKEAGINDRAEVDPEAERRLLHETERHKIELSRRESATFYLPGYFRSSPGTLDHVLTRAELERMTWPLIDEGIARIKALLESCRLSSSHVSRCLVTGGMAAMPSVASRLHELFDAHRVEVADNGSTLIAEGAAWMGHDGARLQLARTVEVRLARGTYLPLIQAGTRMPVEREILQNTWQLYCVDPRDGSAKFELMTPQRSGRAVQTSDPRTPLATLIVGVDHRAEPFRERLELTLALDENLILTAKACSTNAGDKAETEVHDLEFGMQVPEEQTADPTSSDGLIQPRRPDMTEKDPAPAAPLFNHEKHDLTIRSNLASVVDDQLVPGDLLYTYNPSYFSRANHAPLLQEEERLYYQPCAVCKRRSGDPDCLCGSTGQTVPSARR